jgi:hypothetical protein
MVIDHSQQPLEMDKVKLEADKVKLEAEFNNAKHELDLNKQKYQQLETSLVS